MVKRGCAVPCEGSTVLGASRVNGTAHRDAPPLTHLGFGFLRRPTAYIPIGIPHFVHEVRVLKETSQVNACFEVSLSIRCSVKHPFRVPTNATC